MLSKMNFYAFFKVSAALKEPFAGWIDSWNGSSPVFGFILHGFLRFLHVGPTGKLDLIPVDHVVNLTIAAAWSTASASTLQETLILQNDFKNLQSTA